MSKNVGKQATPSAKISQAQGMVSVQVPCTLDDALLLMSARADTNDFDLELIAAAVVNGIIRFD